MTQTREQGAGSQETTGKHRKPELGRDYRNFPTPEGTFKGSKRLYEQYN